LDLHPGEISASLFNDYLEEVPQSGVFAKYLQSLPTQLVQLDTKGEDSL